MDRILGSIRLAAILLALFASAPALADSGTAFARVATDDDDQPRALQLAITTYEPTNARPGVSVDLVSAIHIGDSSYYADLNRRFEDYDVLLYELVAPPEAIENNRLAKRKGLLSTTQIGMTKLLDLSFQLDEIDYEAPNFVHADLSPQELRNSMADRGESLYVYFWRIFFASLNEYAKDPLGLRDWEMLSAVVTAEEDHALKTMLAYEMTNIDTVRNVLGDDADSAVIGARNQRAIDVLKREIDGGAKRIGIFYGVAHMPDLEARLIEQLGLFYKKTAWVDAWQLGASSGN